MAPVSESTSGDVRATAIRRILATTVAVEATVVGGYGIWLAVSSVTQRATERGAGVALAVAAIVLAGGLAVAVVTTVRARRAARAPIIVWQILQAALAKDALTERSPWGVVLIGLAVVAVVGACWPGVLGGDQETGEPAG